MPNIEIHGLDPVNANLVKQRIDMAMIKNGFKHEAITTTYNVKTESCDGERTRKPFLRICSSENNGEQIAGMIAEENVVMDVELVHVDKFIPAKKWFFMEWPSKSVIFFIYKKVGIKPICLVMCVWVIK